MMREINRLKVDLGERSYEIVIGSQILKQTGELVKPIIKGNRVIIVTDIHVAPIYLDTVIKSLESIGIELEQITLPAGEKIKSIKYFDKLIEDILRMNIDRKVAIIALGGGVIGDLAGFAASSILRGVDLIQVPTTLLSQVDSSVGGKTGLNTQQGKNLIGAFYQPRLVITDIDTLDSLPRRQLLAGYAEIVKYGLINNPDFFFWLEKYGHKVCGGDKEFQREAISISCKSKIDIVTQDEKEESCRALLNLGHTFGHALEKETGFGNKLFHGESVSIGICMAFELSSLLGFCSEKEAARIRDHYIALGLPTSLGDLKNINWEAGKLLHHMKSDKKTENGSVNFILAKGIGKSFLSRNINMNDVKTIIKKSIHQHEPITK